VTRSQADPDTEPVFHESHVSIGHGPGRAPERLMLIGLVLLVLLVIKPWGATPEPATAPGPVLHVDPTATPPSFKDMPCAGRMWLVEADARWAGQTVRYWVLTDAVEDGVGGLVLHDVPRCRR